MDPLDGPISGLVGGCRSILTPPMVPVPKRMLQVVSAGVRRGSPPRLRQALQLSGPGLGVCVGVVWAPGAA